MQSKGMTRISLLLFSILISFSSLSQVSSLRVMTFNIRYNNPADSLYSWENRKEMVFGVITKYQPDVIGIQEALKDQVYDLQEGLKGYAWYGVGRDDGKDSGEYCAIFYKKERFEVKGSSTFWLSETPEKQGSRSWNSACTRIVSWMRVRERKSNQEILILNTHFDHASEEARIESARLLLNQIGRMAGVETPVILTGDFNSTKSDMAYSILTNTSPQFRLTDSRLMGSDTTSEVSFSFVGFPFHPRKGELIDFIFLKNDKDLKIRKYHVITDNTNGLYPSDHLPVFAEIDILKKK